MTAKKILELIKTANPSDTARLDEIDARVLLFIDREWYEGKTYRQNIIEFFGRISNNNIKEIIDHIIQHQIQLDEFDNNNHFTRSRDALKTIRPEGWDFICSTHGFCRALKKPKNASKIRKCIDQDFIVEGVATEELAELHAIIQAIESERAK